MYYAKNGILDKEVGQEVQYVDPVCPEATWDKIATSSKTYVWGVNCPVVTDIANAFVTEDGILFSILKESWRILKKSGQVVFPGKYGMHYTVDEFQNYINNNSMLNKWQFSIVKVEDFPISLGHINQYSGKSVIHPILAVFTKPMSGGRKRQTLKKHKLRRTKA